MKNEILFRTLTEGCNCVGRAEILLENQQYSTTDLLVVGLRILNQWELNENISKKQCNLIYESIEALLKHGLNPNEIFNGDNIMRRASFISSGYLAADLMRLFLEYGGKTNLVIEDSGLFDDIDFDIIFGAINQDSRKRFDELVHCWLVMIGFGARNGDGSEPVTIIEKAGKISTGDFKNHRNFYWGLMHTASRGESWTMHIFDKRTGWDVARL